MKKKVLITYIIGVFAIANVFCMIIGPMTWFNSYTHYSKLEQFEKEGKRTFAQVTGRYTPNVLVRSRVRSYYLDVTFENEKSELIYIEDISVKSHVYNNVNIDQEVQIYYKNDGISKPKAILLLSYDIDKVPMSIHPYWGKWITIISYGIFIFGIGLLIRLKIKNKPAPYIQPEIELSNNKQYKRKKNPSQQS